MRLIFSASFIALIPGLLISTSALAQSAAPAPSPWAEELRQDESPQDNCPRLNARLINPQPLQNSIQPPQDLPVETSEDRLSPVEEMYSARVVDQLTQFGYELFTRDTHQSSSPLPAGAAQDDFVLSIGDELSIVMRGQRQLRMTAQIDNGGLLIIDELQPVSAAGRTIKQVRTQIENEVAQLYNTDVFISLTKVSQVSVLVIGDVATPGRKTLTSFDTVLDALSEAGGITRNGTLRQVRLIRDGRTMMVDLYGLLIYGSDAVDMNLRNGDKIMVRPLGPTVAVAGGVKRPGIYEVLPALAGNWSQPEAKSQRLSLNDLLDMSGGVLSTAQNRYIRMAMQADGREFIEDVTDPMARVFGDGDILMVERGRERREGTVELIGAAHTAGIHALSETKSLSALLGREQSLPRETYALIGVIERWNKNGLTRELIAFPPMLVMEEKYDRKLMDGDIIHLFSHEQILDLRKTSDPDAILPMGDAEAGDEAPIDPLIVDFLKERSVFVRGAVRKPGPYPVSAGATLETVLAMAGGASIEANTRNVEVSRAVPSAEHAATIPLAERRLTIDLADLNAGLTGLGAGDTVRLNQKYRRVEDNHVLLVGEVANPGTYDVMPGDTLGSLITRAGGLTEQAYADGAIFSRTSERKREEGRFQAQARELEMRLAAMLEETDEDKRPGAREVANARDLIAQLRQAEALGRITVEANPAILTKNPEQDILLESGDRVHIPKRPMTVRVAGEVLSPVALQYRKETTPSTYIAQAGGYTYNADKGRAFVVYPDGSARPLGSAWPGSGHGSSTIPPGSTIVVPRDPKPFDFMDTAKDLTQILANLATTAIFATAIRDDRY